MPWVKLDDNAMDHPKILALSDGAFRLWLRGMTYCRKHLTDGIITHLAVKTFRESKASRVKELTTAPEPGVAALWSPCDGGYVMHDYLHWNDSREHVQSMQWKARGRMAQRRSPDVRANIKGTSGEVREPLPTQPNPTPTQQRENALARVPPRPIHPAQRHGLPTLHRGGHHTHAWCSERICVPDFLHDKFRRAIGVQGSDVTLRQFYDETVAGIPDSQPIDSDPLKFWPPFVAARWPPQGASDGTRTAALKRASAEFLAGFREAK